MTGTCIWDYAVPYVPMFWLYILMLRISKRMEVFLVSVRKIFETILLVLSALLVAAKTISEGYRLPGISDREEQ